MSDPKDKWRAEFDQLGYTAVRDDMAKGGYQIIGGTLEKLEFARQWLKEQDDITSAANARTKADSRLLSLRISAIIFGVLWTAGMLWWSAPLDGPKIVIWSIAGILSALAWYWLMGLWLKSRAK